MTTKKMWILGLATTVMIAMVLLAGTPSVAANDQPSGSSADVKIDNFSFGPQTLTISVGTTVVWTNRDDIPHTVVSSDGMFNLGSAIAFAQTLPHGVYVAMNGRIFDWDNVKKNRSSGQFEEIRNK